MPERLCKVTVDSAGIRHTMEVEADSLFAAVFAYNSNQICGAGNLRSFPKLTKDTEIEVESDGRVLRTTFRAAMAWANRKAERENRRQNP